MNLYFSLFIFSIFDIYIYIYDAFFNRTGMDRVGVVGPELELELSLGRSAGSGRWTPLQKQETKRTGGGFARCHSDA